MSRPLGLNSNLFSKFALGVAALVFPQPSTVSKSMLNAGPKVNAGSCGATSGILFSVGASESEEAVSGDSGWSSPGLESWAPSVLVGQDISGRLAPPAVFRPPDVTGGEDEKILEKKLNLFSFRLFEPVDDIGGIVGVLCVVGLSGYRGRHIIFIARSEFGSGQDVNKLVLSYEW